MLPFCFRPRALARIELDFRAEVRLSGRRVTVRVEVERLGTPSLTIGETIASPSGGVMAKARIVAVRWDPDRRKRTPFSEAEGAQLEPGLTR